MRSGDLGTAPDVEMNDFTIVTMPARFAALGDLHAGIDDAARSTEPLLDWADRDERDRGLVWSTPVPTAELSEAEGEPPQVQPSPYEPGQLVGTNTRPEQP